MRHISTKSNIMVAEVPTGFADIYEKPYFAVEYQEEIKKANLLLIPSENIREGMEPVFPEFTSDFLRYLRANAGEGVVVDIAVDDANYRRLVLHSSPVALATMVVRDKILEQCADLVVGFLKEMADGNQRYEDEMDTYVNIIVEGEDFIRKIMFTGRVSECREALDLAIQEVFRGGAR
ncbi:MAG: hypothetical protein KBT01_07735 [Clostridiales bacterium]|nr:hypothetical protein [Candidatus Blautia equi]